MYQVLVFSILLLCQLSLGETSNPVSGDEPYWNGGGASGTGSTNISLNPTPTPTPSPTPTPIASNTKSSCEIGADIGLCLCKQNYGTDQNMYGVCVEAAASDPFLHAVAGMYFAQQRAGRGVRPTAIPFLNQPLGIDPGILSAFQQQQQTGGMDIYAIMQLMQLLEGNSQQGDDFAFTGQGQ